MRQQPFTRISERRLDELKVVDQSNRSRGLTLATLCDMVLGEDAKDQSDEALIRAVGLLIRNMNIRL